MRTRTLLIIAAIVFGLIWWLNSKPDEKSFPDLTEVEATPASQTEVKSAQEPTPPRPQVIARETTSPQTSSESQPGTQSVKSSTPKRRTLPPNTVSYRREGRLLVAFGDIVLGLPRTDDTPDSGIAEAPRVQNWDSSEIAYVISPKLEFPERVQEVIQYFNENTPIRFVPYSGQKDAIVFEPTDKNCRSYLGRIGGHQPLYLSKGCYEREISHELMHALGFIHEHSRTDRDQYVKINWERIENDKADQFDLAPETLMEPIRNRPFDYQSVMIYEPSSFPRVPGDITMESITSANIEPTESGLSKEDLLRLQDVYGHRK